MKKGAVLLSLCFFFGLYVFVFWLSGSHGNIQFRPHMTEDWILAGLLLMFWGVPLFFIIRFAVKKLPGVFPIDK